jgi:hypothetical protein
MVFPSNSSLFPCLYELTSLWSWPIHHRVPASSSDFPCSFYVSEFYALSPPLVVLCINGEWIAIIVLLPVVKQSFRALHCFSFPPANILLKLYTIKTPLCKWHCRNHYHTSCELTTRSNNSSHTFSTFQLHPSPRSVRIRSDPEIISPPAIRKSRIPDRLCNIKRPPHWLSEAGIKTWCIFRRSKLLLHD